MDPSATYRLCLLCPCCQDPPHVVVVHHLVPPVDIPRLDKARAPIDCGLLVRRRRPQQRLRQSFVQMMCTPLARAGGGRVCDCYCPTEEYVRFFLCPFSSLALKPRRPMLTMVVGVVELRRHRLPSHSTQGGRGEGGCCLPLLLLAPAAAYYIVL